MKQLILSFFLISQLAYSKNGVLNSQEVTNLFKELSHAQKSRLIKTKGCNKDSNRWIELLATQKPFESKLSYNDKCDIAGKYEPSLNKFFPFQFNIRNFKSIKNLNGKAKLQLKFTDITILEVELKDTKIMAKHNYIVDAVYRFEIDLFNQKQIIKKRLGGELTIKDLDGKKINQKVKLPSR